MGFPGDSVVKNLCTNAGDTEICIWSLRQEDPLETEVATHSSILAWEIPWTEEPGGLQSMGLQRVRQDWTIEQAHTQAISWHWSLQRRHMTKQGRNGKNPESEALSETVNYEPRGFRSQLQPVTKLHICKWSKPKSLGLKINISAEVVLHSFKRNTHNCDIKIININIFPCYWKMIFMTQLLSMRPKEYDITKNI